MKEILSAMIPEVVEYNRKLYKETSEELKGIVQEVFRKELNAQRERFIKATQRWIVNQLNEGNMQVKSVVVLNAEFRKYINSL